MERSRPQSTSEQYAELAEQQRKHHEASLRARLQDGSVEVWFSPDNADFWGNTLALKELEKPFRVLPERSILTVGDGKGGKDAAFFKSLGHRVTATDICPVVLEEAHRRGHIDHFSSADAENLAFDDGSFDIVLAKETLHHLPRPYLALYEMLRVAREGIVLVEPHYRHAGSEPPSLRSIVRCITRRASPHPIPQPSYEPSGNFVFKLNPYELTQIARAMGLPAVAFGYGNFFYQSGCESIRGEELKKLISQKEKEFAEADARRGIESRPLIIALMWKAAPPGELAAALREAGFRFEVLERM